MTGYFCPGCGATRATKALADFRVDEAFRQNAFFTTAVLVGLPLVFLGAAREKFPEVSWLRPFRWRKNFFWFFLAALLLFTALRNLPGFVVLAPK